LRQLRESVINGEQVGFGGRCWLRDWKLDSGDNDVGHCEILVDTVVGISQTLGPKRRRQSRRVSTIVLLGVIGCTCEGLC